MSDGAVQPTTTLPPPGVPKTLVGRSGTASGTTALLEPEGELRPMPFAAVTVKR